MMWIRVPSSCRRRTVTTWPVSRTARSIHMSGTQTLEAVRQLVTVETVTSITRIENADAIEVVRIPCS